MREPATRSVLKELFCDRPRCRPRPSEAAAGTAVPSRQAPLLLVFPRDLALLLLDRLLLDRLLLHRHALNGRRLFAYLRFVELFQKRVQIGYGGHAFFGSFKLSGCALPQDMRPRFVVRSPCPRQKRRCLMSVITLARH